MRNKSHLMAVILSACILLSVCPALAGQFRRVRGYGSFAACDTWQKWVKHITGGDLSFAGTARHDKKTSRQPATSTYTYNNFTTDADGRFATDEYHDEGYTAEAWGGEYMTYEYQDIPAPEVDSEYPVCEYDEEYVECVGEDVCTGAATDQWYDEEDCFTIYFDAESIGPYRVEPDSAGDYEETWGYEETWADPSYDSSYYADMTGDEAYDTGQDTEYYDWPAASYYDDDACYGAEEYADYCDDRQYDSDDCYYDAGEDADWAEEPGIDEDAEYTGDYSDTCPDEDYCYDAPQTEDDYQESDYQDDTCRDDQAGYADYEEYYDSEYEDCPSDYEDPAYSD